MKCFYSNSDAIGICKSCGRGLSREFAVEYPKGVARKGRCEESVEALIDRSTKISATSASIVRSNALTMMISGLFFASIGAAFLVVASKSRGFELSLYMGFAFIAYSGCVLFRAYKTRMAASK